MIPVYVFLGFLEAGKTALVQETLEDPEFNTGEKTLLVVCEEGVEEYEPERFAGGNVTQLLVEDPDDLTPEFLRAQASKVYADRVLVEYNGMWPVQALFDNLPANWEVFQVMTVADATTFPQYLANMRQQTVDKLQTPDVVIFNRCDKNTDKTLLHRSVRMVNRRAQILFEYKDGSIEPDDTKDPPPYDMTAPVIEIGDEDFGVFYLDVFDRPLEYEGKTVKFKAYVCQTDKVDSTAFIAGRFCMTCCAEDITFIGLGCSWKDAAKLGHRTWVDVTARIETRRHPIYEGEGPWLVASSITPAQPPKDELVYFV